MNSRTRMRRRGLTLIEVLLVIVILGLLGSVAVVVGFNVLGSSKVDITKAKLDNIGSQVDVYRLKLGLPTTDQGLQALISNPFEGEDNEGDWAGPYIKPDITDAWGNPIQYELLEDEGSSFKLFSSGPDGEPETDDDIIYGQTATEE